MRSACLTHAVAIEEADVDLKEKFSCRLSHGSCSCNHGLAKIHPKSTLNFIEESLDNSPESRSGLAMNLCESALNSNAHGPVQQFLLDAGSC